MITTEDRKVLREFLDGGHAGMYGSDELANRALPSLLDALDAKDVEIERLRAALKPFADYAAQVTDGWPDGTGCSLYFMGRKEQPKVTIGDCRNARKALEAP